MYADGNRPPANPGWEEEEALDIEWAHAVAPHAKIVLVEAADASAAGLYQAVDKAAALHPAVVSNSWGMPEFSEESFYDGQCKLTDAVCTQSTGDAGYPAGYSSTNPNALAIGGTSLQLDAGGATLGETAWSSTGGGLSYFEKRPAYQDGVQNSAFRATPDVSFVADPNTGVAVYTTATGRALWLEVGGTSLSAPVWGALLTDADQLRATAGKPHLSVAGPNGDTAHGDVYALGGKLNDVTSGSNGACGAECTAGPGYDTVTGLGSPLAGVDTALAAMK
ncbi:S53 family peptidase [Actinacidiphila acidipaludis]|uniref:S53 family peptidase n=1 Tax=Actinacidiphila acidipaludis TaxID=2873382 RepID=A0ABS7QFG4_9ACTN|nr:S53 family peptidase [Streptomyces acidipaludis]MBY8881688.1 S53 family peptidase [Streptomyces acidipaludis]